MWCLSLLFFNQQDAANRQTAGIKFTHRPKISIFTPEVRLIAQIHMKFDVTKGARGSACSHEISRQSVQGVGTWPKNIKNFHFLVKRCLTVRSAAA